MWRWHHGHHVHRRPGGGSGGGTATRAPTATTGDDDDDTTATTTAATGTGGAAPIDCTTVFPAGIATPAARPTAAPRASACNDAPGCVDCLPDASLCDDTNVDAHDALIACLQASCEMECFPRRRPRTRPASCRPPALGGRVRLASRPTITCNPVTNAPCNTAAGEACDFDGAGYQCYPAPNDKKLCEPCGSADGFCEGGGPATASA